MRITGKLLDLTDNRARDHWERLFRAQHQPDALSLHALDDVYRARIRGGVVAEGAIEEGFELRRGAVPIDWSRCDKSLRRQIVIEKHGAKSVFDSAVAIRLSTFPAVP